MKRFLGFAVAMFIALVAIALVGGDTGAVAGHGCHGRRCHGGLHAHHRCHGREKKCHGGLLARLHSKKGCHGEAAPACESGCESGCEGGCGEAAECGSCGGEVSGGCAGGACGGEGVISAGTPTEAAPAAPAAPASGT
jgi:hypothetical protein